MYSFIPALYVLHFLQVFSLKKLPVGWFSFSCLFAGIMVAMNILIKVKDFAKNELWKLSILIQASGVSMSSHSLAHLPTLQFTLPFFNLMTELWYVALPVFSLSLWAEHYACALQPLKFPVRHHQLILSFCAFNKQMVNQWQYLISAWRPNPNMLWMDFFSVVIFKAL